MEEIRPKCLIIMAYHNGSDYLAEQLNSLSCQVGVDVEVLISDDNSNPEESAALLNIISDYSFVSILNPPAKLGSSAKNFFRLIQHANTSHFDCISFCDQDDIWFDNKLLEDCKLILKGNFVAVSSPTTPYSKPGMYSAPRRMIVKPTKYDYVFESAGQGCTYTMNRFFFDELASFVKENICVVENIYFHDWFVYAYSRSRGYSWGFNQYSLLYYRQHSNNVIGSRGNIKSLIGRIKMLSSGWYFRESKKICLSIGCEFWDNFYKSRGSLFARTKFLVSLVFDLRRSKIESFLIFILLFMIDVDDE